MHQISTQDGAAQTTALADILVAEAAAVVHDLREITTLDDLVGALDQLPVEST